MERQQFLKSLGISSFIVPLLASCGDEEVSPVPIITGFTPSDGSVGTSVVITGTNFSSTMAGNVVSFNGTAATVSAATTTQLSVTVPTGATTGKISVTVGSLTATSSDNFTVSASSTATATLTSFSPSSGAVGTTVIVTGTNFSATGASNTVTFNGISAVVSSATTTQLTVTVPLGASTGKIAVTTNGNTATSTADFTVTAASTELTITSFTGSGAVGSTIIITGANFSTTASNNTVTINGVTAAVTAATATQLTVTVPAGATSGVISVTVGGVTVTSATAFTVSSASCTATDSETEGPFPTKDPSSLVMADIRSDRTGVAFNFTITIQNNNNSCAALEGAIVDVWHCDKDGYYSEYGGTQMQTVNYTTVHFLRGRQVTDSNGQVGFTSIFPGWYQSRATHIHVHVYNASGKSLLVTQIGFPEGTDSAVVLVNASTANGYTKGMTGYTYNASDNVFTDSQDTEIGSVTGSVAGGYVLSHTIVVKA